jgi:hypothetical protein
LDLALILCFDLQQTFHFIVAFIGKQLFNAFPVFFFTRQFLLLVKNDLLFQLQLLMKPAALALL